MLNENGFYRPTYAELLKGQIKKAKELFGNDIETAETTALGKFIRLSVYDISKLYEQLESAYYARFPNTARGTSLDRLMPFAGISRNPATRAVHKIKLFGEPDSIIEAGFLFSTASGINFYLINNTVINKSGEAVTEIECCLPGKTGNVEVGTIINIVNPCSYLDTVEHISIIDYGSDIENDVDLRKRFSNTIAGSGTGTIDSIYCEIMRVQNVRGCMIVENDTNTADSDGRPPNSFECYVLGGNDSEIAKAIWAKKPVGIKCVGDISIDITDKGGFIHQIKFSRTVTKPIYIQIKIKVNNLFERNGESNIKDNIINFILQLANGEDVILSSLFSQIHNVTGVVETTDLLLSDDGMNYSSDNILCKSNEVARVGSNAIEIKVDDYID